jgi:hypothetical protein
VRTPILALIAALLSVVVGGSVLVSSTAEGEPVDGHDATRHAPAEPRDVAAARGGHARTSVPAPLRPDLSAPVSVETDGFLTWAVRDRHTGGVVGAGDEVNTTESMIKVWIVADHLRRLAERGATPDEATLADASAAIRDSDNDATQRLYAAGGYDRVVARMIATCALPDTEISPGRWSETLLSARDAVRLGECVAGGTAAGPVWTGWLLDEMRQVRGTTADKDQRAEDGFEGGRWGIIDGLPGQLRDQVAIKNGWTRIGATDSWHLNCLAVTDDWVLAVLMRYPAGYSIDYGAERCALVAEQLFHHPDQPPSDSEP